MGQLRTIILAAGKSVRMKSAIPKVLHEIAGRTLISYVVEIAKAVGSLKTYVIVGHQGSLVRAALDRTITPVMQRKLLGTADAVKCAKGKFKNYNGDVLILCGDAPLVMTDSVRKLIRKHRATKAGCTILTSVVRNPKGYGRIIRDEKKRVVAIREENDALPSERAVNEVNTGVYCFKSKELFRAIGAVKLNRKKKEFYLTDMVALMSAKGVKIESVMTPDSQEGLGVNSRQDLATAGRVLRKRILDQWMSRGITIVDPRTTYIDQDVVIGEDTVIRPFCVIEGNVRIGKRCVIGPFCHLRPGTRLKNNVTVGNFAEVSRSSIDEGTLMKHFSFLGDAHVGKKVNIGAGVVTANYDGINKNKTAIAREAFIGSDSILVAPVTIGPRARTGAGCVVTKGTVIPQGAVFAGVPAKKLIRRKKQ